MFKKLKDKIAEEVKSSPQRIQQLTQSVVQNISSSDGSLFTIADEDIPKSESQSSFTEVSLNNTSTPSANSSYGRQRRNSNSSIASDVSFLPRYESPSNQYHLQSDLDMSVSEMEDDTTSVSKEQIYQAFRKAQVRYHKYRGRYTDLSNHYRELERENAKMKQVLVETQDKALRRVSELKEQCNLEKSAKAHLENALRVEIDEKQYVIDSLKQKLEILDTSEDSNNLQDGEELEILQRDLEGARREIETLNERLEATKSANFLKEHELEATISELRLNISEKSNENAADFNGELKETLEMKSLELKAKEIAENELRSIISGLQKDVETKTSEITSKSKENEQKFSKQLEEHKVTIEKMQKEYEGRIKEQESVLKAKETDVKSLKSKMVEIQEKLSNLIAENQVAVEKLTEEHRKTVADLKGMLETKQTEADRLRESLDQLSAREKENSAVLAQNSESQNRLEQLKQENEETRKEKERLEAELAKIRQETKQGIINLQEKMMEKEEKWKTEREKLLLSLKNEENDKVQKKFQSLESDLKDRNDFIELLEKENAKVKEECANTKRKMGEMESLLRDSKENSSEVIKNYQLQIENFKQENNEQKSSIEAVKKHLGVLEQKLHSSAQKISDLEKQVAAATKEKRQLEETIADHLKTIEELKETYANQRQSLERELEALRKTRADLEVNFKALSDENEVLVNGLEMERKANEGNAQKLREVQEKASELAKINQVIGEEKGKLENELKIITGECRTVQESLEVEKKIHGESVRNLKQVEDALSQLKDEKENLLKDVHDFDRRKGDLEVQYKEKMQSLSESVSNSKKALDERETKIKQLQKDLKTVAKEKQSLEETIDSERKKIKEQEASIKELQENLNTVSKEKLHVSQAVESDRKELVEKENAIKRLQEDLKAVIKEKQGLLQKVESERKTVSERDATVKQLQVDLKTIGEEKQSLQQEMQRFTASKTDVDAEKTKLSEDNCRLRENLKTLAEKQEQLLEENEHVRQDYENLTVENVSLRDFQQKFQIVSEEKLNLETKINTLREDYNNTVTASRESYETAQTETAELNRRLESAIEEIAEQKRLCNDSEVKLEAMNQDISEKSATIDKLEKEIRDHNETDTIKRLQTELGAVKTQLGHAEHQLMEVVNEKQLLQDELNELKISPVETAFTKSNAKADLLQGYPNGVNYEQLQSEHEKTLLDFKTMEETNRTTISFYETQVEKLKNKNEKLLRKLDETLVTLSHFSELNGSTEIEYLRNVLYNYMLGKESMVLARVIAAVCKFDPVQTETVLQKEQQKQTLLGQLGIL